ncbi:hypothetical protein XYCOK13_25720 [Xylanibacillus composti]|uniref:Uncharacterized protein n=1 Tax=Xylanibacillus composti TaxID=1572762 RepID=A0A8J4H2I5_9BACL|nr:hypothetical protein XYCOK13_25720 [Xylanibacillus composti]
MPEKMVEKYGENNKKYIKQQCLEIFAHAITRNLNVLLGITLSYFSGFCNSFFKTGACRQAHDGAAQTAPARLDDELGLGRTRMHE